MAKKPVKKAKPRSTRKPAPRKKKVEAIPKRYGAVTPSLVVRGGAAALAFYARAFGAKEVSRMPGPEGKIMHADFTIGGRMLMLNDEWPEMGARSPQTVGGTASSVLLYFKDVDAAHARAVEAGATSLQPPEDQFWGDRYARVRDPFGHEWQLATHVEDVSVKEMMRRMAALPPPHPPAA